MLELHIRLAGVIVLFLAASYPIYPKHFGWREELQRVSLLTRQIFFIHCGFIVLLLALQGILLAAFPAVLLDVSPGARALLVGLVAFWAFRLVAQIAIYDSRLWKGDGVRTTVHVVFTSLWVYLTAVTGVALWHQVM